MRFLPVDAVVRQVDVQHVVDRIDINQILERVDIDKLLLSNRWVNRILRRAESEAPVGPPLPLEQP